jgi:hypothetical protein
MRSPRWVAALSSGGAVVGASATSATSGVSAAIHAHAPAVMALPVASCGSSCGRVAVRWASSRWESLPAHRCDAFVGGERHEALRAVA